MNTLQRKANAAVIVPWAGAAIGLALLIVCYGFSLRLPFFFDDPPVLSWVDAHTPGEIWTTANENAYYRPLTFTIYWLSGQLEPPARAVALHGLNLALHLGNVWLLALIARRWNVPRITAALASILLVVFPFLYQAVPWVTALPHLLVSTLVLLSIYAFERGYTEKRAGWRLAALAFTLLAPFAHESGAVAGVLVTLVVMSRPEARHRTAVWRWAAAGVLLDVAVVALRAQVLGRLTGSPAAPENWLQNGFLFLQGLIYPVAPLAGQLVFDAGFNDFLVVGLMALGLVAVLVWIAWHGRDWGWLVRGIAWWLCASLPSWLLLKYSYTYISPRLYALAAPGLALLWAELLVRLSGLARRLWWRRTLLALLLSAVVVQNVWFLLRQRQLHLDLNRVYQTVLQVAANPANAPLLFVNLPSWLARARQIYPLSTDGVLFVPGYSDLPAFVRTNLGRSVQASTVMFTPVLQSIEGSYRGRLGQGENWEGLRRAASVAHATYLAAYRSEHFEVRFVGSLQEAQTEPPARPMVTFQGGPLITAVEAQQLEPGYWAVTLEWYSRGPLTDHEIFVHVVDGSGQLVTQADGPALGGMLPIWLWQPGDRIRDVRYIEVPADDKRSYTVKAGVYAASGERLQASSANGEVYSDRAATLVTLPP